MLMKRKVECRCRKCGWRGITAGRRRAELLLRIYLVVAILACAAYAIAVLVCPAFIAEQLAHGQSFITRPVAIGIGLGLPLVLYLLEWSQVCASCGAHSIEIVPRDAA
jgi:hypothetical protein